MPEVRCPAGVGSSPLARGKSCPVLLYPQGAGFIPTRAGKICGPNMGY